MADEQSVPNGSAPGSDDSGIHDSDSASVEETVADNGKPNLPADVVVAELEIHANDPSLVKKERHLSTSSKRSSLKEELTKEYYCGLGRCRPKWMQIFLDARFFTFLLCLNCFIEGALVSGEYLVNMLIALI